MLYLIYWPIVIIWSAWLKFTLFVYTVFPAIITFTSKFPEYSCDTIWYPVSEVETETFFSDWPPIYNSTVTFFGLDDAELESVLF
jgi:hypothetical protein